MARISNRRKATGHRSTSQSISRSTQRSRRFRESYLSNRLQISQQFTLPLARQSLISQQSYRHSLGPCNIICSSCEALHWIHERSYRSTIHNPLFFSCCQRGQIVLPSFPDAPEPLKSLLEEQTEGISTFIMSFY